MKRTRFLLILVLAFVLAACLFVGCKKKGNEGGNNSGNQTIEQPSDEQPGDEQPGDGKIIVTLSAGGGTLNSESSYEANESGKITEDVADPTWTDHKFLGWYTQAQGGEKIDLATYEAGSAITLYAHWAAECTITFNSNGGDLNGEETIKVYEGEKITSVPTVTLTGRQFYGWFTQAEGGKQIDFNSYTVEGDATLYVHWRQSLAYNKNVVATIVVGAYDGGPAVDKIVLAFRDSIPSSATSGRHLTLGWGNSTMGNNNDKIYLSDRKGNQVNSATSRYVTIEYNPTYSGYGFSNNLSPFDYNSSGGYNSWKPLSNVRLNISNWEVGEFTYTSFSGTLTAEYSVPSLEKWDLTGVHTKDGVNINYGTYSPEVPDGEKRALIVWLHGQGEGYSDMANVDVRTTLLGNKVTPLAENPIQSHFEGGAFVIAPQAPTYWMNTSTGNSSSYNSQSRYFAALEELLRTYVASNPKIDASRVYVGGCSNGGWCTLEVVARMCDFFAACYPVCPPYARGHFTDEMFANLVKVPMWIVTANNDTTVGLGSASNPQNGKALYLDLLAAGKQDLYFSLFNDVTADGVSYMGHFSWIYVFRDEVQYVQAKTGANGAAFTFNNYNPSSTLTVSLNGQTVNMWQWLATFTNDQSVPASSGYFMQLPAAILPAKNSWLFC